MDKDVFIIRLIHVLQALESSFRVDPLMLPHMRENLLAHGEVLRIARDSFPGAIPEGPYPDAVFRSAALVLEAVSLFGSGDDLNQAFMNVLKSYRKFARAQECLFPFRKESFDIGRFFREVSVGAAFAGRDPAAGGPGVAD
jgi:hypothetical protein